MDYLDFNGLLVYDEQIKTYINTVSGSGIKIISMNTAPTSSTLTYTIEGVTYNFNIGDEVVVRDTTEGTEETNYYVVYKLYSIENNTAYWDLGGSEGGGAFGKIKVYLKDIVNNTEQVSPSFAGVVVTLQNTTDSGAQPMTKTIAAGETSCTFTKITPLKDYSISVSDLDSQHTTPSAQTITNLSIGDERELTFLYEANEYTIVITSNLTNDSTIAAKRVTLSYTYGGDNHQLTGLVSGASVKIPANGVTNLTVTADDVTGYAKSVSNVGMVYTISYTTMHLTVALAYQGETAPDLTGVTITVTDTTLLETVAKTDNVYLIPGGHGYKVEVSDDVEGYAAPDAATGTATSTQDAAATVTMTYEEQAGFVDLGLPSGLKWAQANIVKDAQGNYAIGENPEDYGCYFSWGNIVGHNNGEGYDFGTSNSGPYASTPGKQVSANIASNDAQHDAALALLGSPWRLPTKEEFKELYDNTDWEWTTINGINGWKFMKKTDHSVFVFFPAAGLGFGTSISYVGSDGYYWSSSWRSADRAYLMYFNSSSVNPQYDNYRYYGFSVRAVQ